MVPVCAQRLGFQVTTGQQSFWGNASCLYHAVHPDSMQAQCPASQMSNECSRGLAIVLC